MSFVQKLFKRIFQFLRPEKRKHTLEFMSLNPHASRKLWDILSHLYISRAMADFHPDSMPERLRLEARKHQGQTKKTLLRIADLGHKGACQWLEEFVVWMDDKQEKI